MATNSTHHHQRPSLTMSYSQNSIGSANGLSHMGSFNASQSVSSTPVPTPPGRNSQQSGMPYNFTNGVSQSSSFGGYDGTNGYGVMMPYQEDYKPQIYRVCVVSF